MSLDVVHLGFAPPVGDALVDYHDAWQRQLAREGVSAREARLRKDAETRAKEQAQLAEAIDLIDTSVSAREAAELRDARKKRERDG